MDPHGGNASALRVGEFEVDPASHTVRSHGRVVPVGARALDLLWALIEARGQLVTKDELLQRAWPGLVVEEANVQVQVSALRKVLGTEAIATVPSLGYRLALPISEGDSRVARHNLTSERTPFIGRAALLAEAQSRLASGVLLTLIGIGGSGKTRLARRLAELQVDRFDDGVWWVDLAPLDRAEQLAPAVAKTVGCALNGKEPPLVAVARALRTRRMLLVLDNCEHLVDAACELLDALIDAASGLRALATSRDALGLRGEMILPVKPLELPPPDASPEQVWATDAARLFLQAAELASPQLTFDDDHAPTVAAICRQLDGIPLALELAASQLHVLSPQQLLAVLRQRFGLTLGGRRRLPRQQTLHAVIRWSVDSLSESERKVLSALAVCGGGCDLVAAQAIVGSSIHSGSVIASLARLADRSLISVQHVAGAARYYLLETVRQFVLEAMIGHDVAEWHDGHCNHYLQLAETLRPQLSRAERASAMATLDLERENMARAIDWTVMSRRWPLGSRFVRALLPHWTARSWLVPGFELAQAVLAVTEPGDDRIRASGLMLDAANLAMRMGRLELTRCLATEALRQAQQAGSLEHEIDALVTRSYCALLDGDCTTTIPELEVMLERSARAGLHVQQSRVLSTLAQARMEMGDLEATRATIEQARRVYEALGNPTGAVMETTNLAFVAVRMNDAAEARRLLKELAHRQPHIEHHAYACFTLSTVGALACLEGQWARCLRAHLAALRHFESGGVADSRLRRRERERDIERARQALDVAAQMAAERSAASGSIRDDLAWAFEDLG